jgi:hypothetical protein
MADYVQDLSDRISGYDGLPLTRLGRLLDVATMKMTDDHSSKRTERYIMLFENALVICKWRSAEQVAIKRMCLMDKVRLGHHACQGRLMMFYSSSFSSTPWWRMHSPFG